MEMLPVVVLFFCFVLFLPGTFYSRALKNNECVLLGYAFLRSCFKASSPLFSPGDIGGPTWWGQIWTGVTRTSTGSYFSRTLQCQRVPSLAQAPWLSWDWKAECNWDCGNLELNHCLLGSKFRESLEMRSQSLGTIHVCCGEGSRDPVRSDGPVTNEFRSKSTL